MDRKCKKPARGFISECKDMIEQKTFTHDFHVAPDWILEPVRNLGFQFAAEVIEEGYEDRTPLLVSLFKGGVNPNVGIVESNEMPEVEEDVFNAGRTVQEVLDVLFLDEDSIVENNLADAFRVGLLLGIAEA
jgi:hypothetical protein